MSTAEPEVEVDVELVRLLTKDPDRYGYQRFGVCVACRRSRTEDDEPLWLTGRTVESLKCIDCHVEDARKEQIEANKKARRRRRK